MVAIGDKLLSVMEKYYVQNYYVAVANEDSKTASVSLHATMSAFPSL